MKLPSSPRILRTGHRLLMGLASGLLGMTACTGLTLYEFGNPTAEEQQYLELINRARANPSAEGQRLAATTDPDVLAAYNNYGVDLALMQLEFTALLPMPPLAPNASLTSSARSHSAWMLANQTQAHNETNPSNTPFSRMMAAGYTYSTAGENIYAHAKSVWYGHAGFQVDWGTGGTGGMQAGRGHRANIHSANFREIGVGLVLGTNGTVGPQLVTQDFGRSQTNPTLATGVAYYDLNTNNFYDPGEGIAGLTVNVSGADVTQYCNTAVGGGWVVPIPITALTRNVTFTGLSMNQSATLVVPASTNAKADLKLAYVPPSITSSSSATADVAHTLAFAPVGGATAYKWNRWSSSPAAAENCESTSNLSTSTTGSYSVLNTTVKQQGTASFHLENSTGNSQWLQLSPVYFGKTTPSLTYQSRIRYATTTEQFKVQVKEEGSLAWQDVDTQTGTNTPGEAGFSLRSVAFPNMAGKAFRVRFLLNHSGGYYNTSGNIVGWFIDSINFSNVEALGNLVSQTLAGTSGSFTPSVGTYLMSVMPVISNRDFPASYQTLTVAPNTITAPVITSQPVSVAIDSGTCTTLTIAANGTAPSYQWFSGCSPSVDNQIAGATAASYTTPALTKTTHYWVRAINAVGTADSETIIITVNKPFDSWASTLEANNGLAAGTIANQPNEDFDHDGRSNLIEYAFGASPVISNDAAPRMPAGKSTATHYVLTYQRDSAITDLTWTPQASSTLGNWKAPGDAGAPAGFTDTVIATNGTLETHEVKIPRAAGQIFMRVRISQP